MATDAEILSNYTAVADNSPLSKSKIQSLSLRLLSAIYSELISGGPGGGGTATTPGDIGTGIDLSVDIDTIISRLTQIRDNALANQFDYETVLDANGTLWVQRFDRVAGTVVYLTPAGVVGTPVLPLTIDRSDLTPVAVEFEASTTSAEWSPGDFLTRITMVSGTGAPVNTVWIRSDGTALTLTPTALDVQEYGRAELLILRALETIATGGNNLLSAIEGQTDGVEGSLATIEAAIDLVGANTTLDKDAGIVEPETLRVVLASDQAPTTASQRWRVQVTDGTQNMPVGDAATRSVFVTPNDGVRAVTVKAAATAPVAADTALVVAQSPNGVTPPMADYTFLNPAPAASADVAVPGTPSFTGLSVINNSAVTLFLQIHSKAGALANGDTPATVVFRVPANSQAALTRADLFCSSTGQGRDFGVAADVRLGLSTTLATYTAAVATNTRISYEVVV